MNKIKLKQIINYITDQGIKAIKHNTNGVNFLIDYLAIFAKDDVEYNELVELVSKLGKEVEPEAAKTGLTFLLDKSIHTEAGELTHLKIRKPDPTRPQRGAPDFKISNYLDFKDKYLKSSGNFTLMIRDDFEMIELKGIDVLVYFPNKLADERV